MVGGGGDMGGIAFLVVGWRVLGGWWLLLYIYII
jgi:hypothetical protein